MNELASQDADVAEAVRSGDTRRAFELVLAACHDGLYAYCFRLCAAGDGLRVFGRVLDVATERLAGLGILPRAWLYGIAREVVVHYHAQRRLGGALHPDYAPVLAPQGVISDSDPMGGLEASNREVLQLSLWHGLRLREVAYVLRRPLALVREQAAQGLMYTAVESRRGSELPS